MGIREWMARNLDLKNNNFDFLAIHLELPSINNNIPPMKHGISLRNTFLNW
jgi:hypothetical protein